MTDSRRSCAIVAVIPVGPSTSRIFLQDTVESILYYAECRTLVLLVDNAGTGIADDVAKDFEAVDVLERLSPKGMRGPLYINAAAAFLHVLENYDCRVILRVDEDALAIGPFGSEILQFFEKHPKVAIAGSYRDDCMGKGRSFAPPAMRIVFLLTVGAVMQPRLWPVLVKLVTRAKAHGYDLGEHILFGVCALGADALKGMSAQGNLMRPEFIASHLHDDHIFGLLAKASGYELADYATGNLPIGAAWRGLPCSPSELEAREKKLVHSVRSWGDLDEAAIRAYFRASRTQTAPSFEAAPGGVDA
jgi:hypothetical protein